MEPERDDVYGLVGRLCESIFNQSRKRPEQHPYLPDQHDDHDKQLRRLKARAYEILLNKSSKDCYVGDNPKPCDPIVELLKFVYVLKVGAGRVSQGIELQKYLDEFIDEQLETDSVAYSALIFLNSLKSVDSEDTSSLDIFHYGNPHPQLPEMLHDGNSVPPFQVYPIESFHLPEKFEETLKQDYGSVIHYDAAEPSSQPSLLGWFNSSNSSTKFTRHNNVHLTLPSTPKFTTNLSCMSLPSSSYFMPQINDIAKSKEEFYSSKEGIVTEPESPWQSQNPLDWFAKNGLIPRDGTEICEIEDDEEEEEIDINKIWEQMDKISPFDNHKTWETLGMFDPPKEPPFISESIDATLHLMAIAQENLLKKSADSVPATIVVPMKEFLNHVKLLLLGVESNSFILSPSNRFELEKNIAIHGISAGTLENMCYEVTRWGTCFRNLSELIVSDPQTGKLQIEGLIFKALCNSIKEFLLFYHAAVLRVSISENENIGLLKYMNKVRPLGNLIFKVAELCRCENQKQTSLGEGIGILTHIYKEVTKVTEPNVALVFYSILKECCEVYFKFLQHWIFEGACVDIYEEFMIKVRPQYLRTRGHRFWTRTFSINQKSVPGFLSELTDSILQCGKAVTLLRICDPQNPLCRVSASREPPVRVCLSVGMLREQAKFYEDYTLKNELEQGEEVSLYTAIRQQKETEKRRAHLVIAAQQDTLLRLKREREESLKKIILEKQLLLEELKEQAEQAVQRKEEAKYAELIADKIFLEKIMLQEEELKSSEKLERENTIKYYNELAEEAERRRIHSDWRTRRIQLFDKRVMAIASMRREFVNTPDTPDSNISAFGTESEGATEELVGKSILEKLGELEHRKDTNINTNTGKPDAENSEKIEISECRYDHNDNGIKEVNEDENSNPSVIETNESSRKKAMRPTVLDITSIIPHKQPKELDSTNINLLNLTGTDTVIEAKRNKLRVLQQEYDNLKTDIGNSNLNSLDLKETDNTTQAQRNKLKFLQQELNSLKTDVGEPNLNLIIVRETENMTQANRNKLKVLEQEYGVTSNNNDFILTNINDITNQSEPTEIQINRLRSTQHLTHLNWDGVEGGKHPLEEDDATKQLEPTEIQMNRLRNTQHLTHLNWNEVGDEKHSTEQDIDDTTKQSEPTDIQMNRLRNTQHLTHLNWNEVGDGKHSTEQDGIAKQSEPTEIEMNRLRNMQHLTHLDWNAVEDDKHNTEQGDTTQQPEPTEMQVNRLRNMQHLTHLDWNEIEDGKHLTKKDEIRPLTDAQINRNKIMAHTYNLPDEVANISTKPEILTDWQKNRNRNMAHSTQPFDFDFIKSIRPEHPNKAHNTEQLSFDSIRPIEPENLNRETPMSTATDHFTVSLHDSSVQMQSCENTPFSEVFNHSEMMFTGRSSDGMSTDETSNGRMSRYFQNTPVFPHFIGLGSVANTPCAESSQLTIADVEMIDTTSLQVYLEKSVVIPLAVQSRLVNNAIIKHLLNNNNMLSHLHSLRSFFFLLNGEFAKTLTQSLFTKLYEVNTPGELFNSSTLSGFLEKALISSLSSTYANSELLSLSATEIPAYLQTSNPEILSCLSLNYKISWPLNIIFSDVVMQQYSRVFKFLLMVGRVLWVLKEDFHILKIARKTAMSRNLHELQLYRHSMMQFMNALHTYLTCSVLHASWSEFEKELESAKTLDKVYDTHVTYIKKILSRCMLNVRGEKMRTCLCNIFKVVLKFHNRIRTQSWSANVDGDSRHADPNPNFQNLERMYVTFCEQRAYLAHVAEKLASSGYQPHLMQFLLALNINHRSDLAIKK